MVRVEHPPASDVWARHFRMRELDVTLEAATPALDAALAHLVNHADDDMPPRRRVTFRLKPADDGLATYAENDEGWSRPDDVASLLVRIQRRLASNLFAIHEGLTSLHSGAVTIDGRLVLVTGDRGAGKTTLLLRLALDGADFHCDEHVLGGADGIVRTLPRRLHVKPGTLECLPAIKDACLAHPMLHLPGGVAFYPLDLAELGVPWRSVDRTLSAIIHLTPGFEAAPSIEPIAQIDMVKRLFEQGMTAHHRLGPQSANVTGIVRGVPCFAMVVGGLEESAARVRRVVARLPEPAETA
jgi:hypothetical protein